MTPPWGLTTGQAQTLALGGTLAVLTLALGLPPVLSHDVERLTAPAAATAPDTSDPLDGGTSTPDTDDQTPTVATPTTSLPTRPSRTTPAPRAADPEPPATTTTVAPTTTTTTRPPPAPARLRLAASGWAAGPGLATLLGDEIGQDRLPVGITGTREDYRSFARFAGGGRRVELPLDNTSGANRNASSAAVRVCANTAPFDAGGGQALGDAPPIDDSSCVDAAVVDGVLVLDLTSFADPTSSNGFSLVATGPAVFNAVFAPPT